MESEVKRYEVEYDHEDGRKGTIIVTTEVQDSGATKYGNGKGGRLTPQGCEGFGYDLRYAHGDLHMVMIRNYFGDGLVSATEL